MFTSLNFLWVFGELKAQAWQDSCFNQLFSVSWQTVCQPLHKLKIRRGTSCYELLCDLRVHTYKLSWQTFNEGLGSKKRHLRRSRLFLKPTSPWPALLASSLRNSCCYEAASCQSELAKQTSARPVQKNDTFAAAGSFETNKSLASSPCKLP